MVGDHQQRLVVRKGVELARYDRSTQKLGVRPREPPTHPPSCLYRPVSGSRASLRNHFHISHVALRRRHVTLNLQRGE